MDAGETLCLSRDKVKGKGDQQNKNLGNKFETEAAFSEEVIQH